MLISNVNGRDKVEICETEEIKSSSSIKAVDKKVFSWHVCAGKTLCQEFWAPNTRRKLNNKCRWRQQDTSRGSASSEGKPSKWRLGQAIKTHPWSLPSPTGGGERDKIKAKLKERFLEREVQLKDPTDWEEEGDIRREEREGAQDAVGGREGESNQNLVWRDQEPR